MSQLRQISAIPSLGTSYKLQDLDETTRVALLGFMQPKENYISMNEQLKEEKLNRAALNTLGTQTGGRIIPWRQ